MCRVPSAYDRCYNTIRTHQSLVKDTPIHRPVEHSGAPTSHPCQSAIATRDSNQRYTRARNRFAPCVLLRRADFAGPVSRYNLIVYPDIVVKLFAIHGKRAPRLGHTLGRGRRRSARAQNAGYENMIRFYRMYIDASGKVLIGGDTNIAKVPGSIVHEEMEIFLEEMIAEKLFSDL